MDPYAYTGTKKGLNPPQILRLVCEFVMHISVSYVLKDWKALNSAGNVLQCNRTEPGCSKLTTSLVNETLKFQTLISQIC